MRHLGYFWLQPQPRLIIIMTGFLAFFLLLGIRLIDTQILHGTQFRVRADDNRFHTLPILAQRGVLLDRYDQPLVLNTQRYFEVEDALALYQQKTPIDRETGLALMATDSTRVVTSLERHYQYPLALAHALGYVGAVTAEELADGRAQSVQHQIGKLGLELKQERELRGIDGKALYEINALGQRQKKVEEDPAVAGQNTQTTIDPYLSQVAFEALNDQKGAVVISDAKTGQVLAMVSSPSFDPNVFQSASDSAVQAQRQQQIQSLFTDPRQLFFNRAVSGAYPLGSVFKLVTALAGLENNKLNPNETVLDEGILKVGEYQYGNWYYRQYARTEGPIALARAIARSNDIYFYKAAEWVGPTGLADMARLLGFGQTTGIEVNAEARGLVPDPAWKELTLGEQWFLGNTYHFGIGQGDLTVSPIQVAQLLQTIGNHGTLCKPTLLKSDRWNCRELSLKAENLDLVIDGMLDACSPGGTAFPFFSYNEQRRGSDASSSGQVQADLARGAVACKTGTAEFGGADANGHRRTHAWFAAIAALPKNELITASTSAQAAGATPAASSSSTVALAGAQNLHQEWLQRIAKNDFPDELAFVALVESDDLKPFKEGSADAGPVIKTIIDWMWGRSVGAPTPTPAVTPLPEVVSAPNTETNFIPRAP